MMCRLDGIRRDGCAAGWEELSLGLRCVAAPILDLTGCAVAATSISGSVATFSHKRTTEFQCLVGEAAAEISKVPSGPPHPRRSVR